MKDSSPRIFRSLERQDGQRFDTVVAAAVSAFAALRRPTVHQAEDLGRLVDPLWSRVSADTRRHLAAALSHSPRVPRVLVERFLSTTVEIAAPFLVSSPVLTDEDLDRLSRSPDERMRRLAANRQARLPVTDRDAAPRRLPLVEAPPLAADDVATPGETPAPVSLPAATAASTERRSGLTAAEMREALRRLVLGARAQPVGLERPTPADLVAAAMESDEPTFRARLMAMLDAGPGLRARLEADRDGDDLAVAMKAADVPTVDAMTILMLLRPEIGLDIQRFDGAKRRYAALRLEDCRRLVATCERAATGATRSPIARTAASGEAARREFGRRPERPNDKPRESNG